MINNFHNNRFNIAMLPRQSGKTISVVSYLLWYACFNSDKTVAILANKGATANEILARFTLALENIPFFLQPGCKVLNKGSIKFSNNTRVIARATSSSSIRGESVNLLAIDEFGFIQNAETFYTATYPVITAGESSKVIITSTPNGVGNPFHSIWTGAITKTNSYVPFQVNWRDVPGRNEKWKEETIANTSLRQFEQEYECSFHGSGKTLISGNKLLGMSAQKPILANSENTIFVYENPIEDHSYIIIVDVGRGRGQDYSAFSIIDITNTPFKQVLTYYDNMVSPVLLSVIINKYGTLYNNAFAIIETNDNGSLVVNSLFQDFEYENIYTEIRGGRTSFGVETTRKVKALGCSSLKDLIESSSLLIYDENTIRELCTFVTQGSSYGADSGNHDDLVMTLVLFSWFSSIELFKSFTDIDIKQDMFEQEIKNLENELVPVGFIGSMIEDASNKKEYENFGGQLWEKM
jgi:hypothetical protein